VDAPDHINIMLHFKHTHICTTQRMAAAAAASTPGCC
jgi:hypothetical protein